MSSEATAPVFSFDGDPTWRQGPCGECDELHDKSAGFVLRDGHATAVYYASWSPHDAEVHVEMVLGSWDDEAGYPDHVTFGCRLGASAGHAGVQRSLVPGGTTLGDKAMFGQKLTRDQALAHPWIELYWDLVDWLVDHDPLLHDRLPHPEVDA